MDSNFKWLYEFARRDPEFSKYFPCPPFDPSKSYEEIMKIYPGNLNDFLVIDSIKIPYNEILMKEAENNNLDPEETIATYLHVLQGSQENINNGYLDLRINFNKVNSIEKFKEEMKDIIDYHWKRFKKNHGHSTIYDTKDFKSILLVGTLKDNHKASYGEIIKHPDFPRDHKDPGRKAKALYNDYKSLIKGGWKNYLK